MQCLRRSSTLRTLQGTPLIGATPAFAIRTAKAAPVAAAAKPRKSREQSDGVPVLDKAKAVEELQKRINKQYGKGTMMKLTDKPIKVPMFSSGLPSVDLIMGGGVPVGRIVEIFGHEGSGKTTLAFHMLAGAQEPDHYVAYIDTENAMNPEYATTLGLIKERAAIVNGGSGEKTFSICLDAIRERILRAICIDSAAGLVPEAELEGEIEDQQMGLLARLMSKGMRNISNANQSSPDPETSTTIIMVNQTRSNLSVNFYRSGPQEVRPGGKAIPFHAWITIEVKAGPKIQNAAGAQIGHKLRVKTKKNKTACPHQSVELDLIYGHGICKHGSLLDAALQMDVIKQSGSYYSFDGSRIGQGRATVIEKLKEDKSLAQKIKDQTMATFEERSGWNDPTIVGNNPTAFSDDEPVNGVDDSEESPTADIPV